MAGLAQLIHDFRSRHGLTQAELAERIGVKQNTVSQYEAGTAQPSIEVIMRLRGVSPEDEINRPLALLLSDRMRVAFPPDRPDEQPSVTWDIPGKFDEDLDDILDRLRGHGAAPGIIRLMKAYRRTGNDQAFWACFDAAAGLAEYSLLRKFEDSNKKRWRRAASPKKAKKTG